MGTCVGKGNENAGEAVLVDSSKMAQVENTMLTYTTKEGILVVDGADVGSLSPPPLWSGADSNRRDFFLIDPAGKVQTFRPYRSSCEDDLSTVDFYVDLNQFCKRESTEHGLGCEIDERVEVVFDDLEAVSDPETQAFVTKALDQDRAAQEGAKLSKERAGDQKIASIKGASDKYALGDDFDRAQNELIARVRTYSDEVAERLLRTLVVLAVAEVDATVIKAYALGCRHACFGYNYPDPSSLDALRNDGGKRDPDIAKQVASLAALLQSKGDVQADGDAMNTARTYWSAAKAVSKAAELLA